MRVATWKKRTVFAHTILPLLLLLITAVESVGAEQLPVKIYTTADGLAHDRVRRIVRDSRGFLWFCTVQGLSRFDGYRFVTYSTEQGLASASVVDLLETREGVYWAATDGGISRLNLTPPHNRETRKHLPTADKRASEAEQLFTSFPVGAGARNIVNILYQDKAGNILVGTDDGVLQLEETGDGGATFRPVDLGIQLPVNRTLRVRAFLEDREGSLWIGTSQGLVRRLPGGEMVHYLLEPFPNRDFIRALLQDRNGRLWVGHNAGLAAFIPEPDRTVATGGRFSTRTLVAREIGKLSSADSVPLPHVSDSAYRYDETINRKGVRDVYESSDGRLWFAQHDGLGHFDGQRFRVYETEHGITGDAINVLTADADDNLWLGTDTGGALKIARTGFVSYSIEKRGHLGWVAAVFEDRAGALYAMDGDTGAINVFAENGFVSVKPNLPATVARASRGFPRIALRDRQGEWWVATAQGLYRFPPVADVRQLARASPLAVYTTREGLAGDSVYQTFEDSRGDIWIGTNAAGRDVLTRWERATGEFHRYSVSDGLHTPSIGSFAAARSFAEDASGNVWIGFGGGGLARYAAAGAGGRFAFFTGADGLAAGEIHHLYFDHRGRLWIASNEGGVNRVDDPAAERLRFQSYTVREGLASNTARCVTEDDGGRIYVGTASGVNRLDPETNRIRHFTTADGLSNNEVGAAFRDRRGALWFGTLDGVSRFVPEVNHPALPQQSPPILIANLRVAGVSFPINELGATEISVPDLEANENNLQVDFLSLGFATGGNLRYQYRLEGADREWSPPTAERTISYANLAPGTYRFLVRAINTDEQPSATPATISFRILPPIWQRWWFVTLLVLLIAGIVHQVYRYRVRRLLELERVRTRIATDLHDDIGSSLSQIAILSEVVRQRVGRDERFVAEPLSQISGASSELMDTMSDIVWAIDPRKDHLSDLTGRMRRFASDVFTARDIEFNFRAPDASHDMELGADVRRQVFLIFKESVNNVVRHSRCTRADIEFHAGRDRITLVVEDNGRGFDAAQEWDGHGMVSMRQRTEELGGSLEVVSNEGKGTTVTLRIPGSRGALRRKEHHLNR